MIAAPAARYLLLVDAEVAERLIRQYVDGWCRGDAAMILAVPRSFAIPVVIGGSSEQQTAVRVDQVDLVRLGSGSSVELNGPGAEWYSYQGPEGTENQNGKRYEVVQTDVPYNEVVVYVWLTVQRYWQGAPGGTCFQQREQQVVVFHPGPQRMQGFIAPGDLYRDPSRMAS